MHYDLTNFNLLKQLLQNIPPDNSCMEWPRGKNRHGYGQLQTWNKSLPILVHRASFELSRGPIPEKLFVCHACDNPTCFRPSHLFLGTQSDNMKDCGRKGRARVTSVLTPVDVREIRIQHEAGARQKDLAARFRVHQTTISDVIHKKHWKTVQ